MITKPAAFRVFGEPAPKGSLAGRCLTHPKVGQVCARAARVILNEDTNRGRPWRRAIEKAAPVHITERADRYQPLAIDLTFAVTRTPAAVGRASPTTRSAQGVGGDLDKMVRLVLDALESCKVLADDAQVVHIDAWKVYADERYTRWHAFDDRRLGRPGMYCRVAPIGWVPPELPYETVLGQDERAGG